ncbi:MAG: hypothetical protein ABGX09_04275 [Thioclava sp.]
MVTRNLELLFGSCSSKFQLDLALPDQARSNAFQQLIIMGNSAVADKARTGDNDFEGHKKDPKLITGLGIPVIQKTANYPEG